MQLIIKDLSKTYSNGVQALKNISLEIPCGMFGLLGPNGAGKSTLMRTIATLQEPDNGTITFGDIDVLKDKMLLRRVLGYLPQEFGVLQHVTAEEMLTHFAVLKGITNKIERKETVKNLLVRTNLYDVRSKKLESYSGGMKQRFGIAQALLGDPKLIIVDEPTAGLDPEERNRFHNLLSEIGENIVVILSTHIVDDVSDLCSKMAVINKGELLVYGDPMTEIERLKDNIWIKLVTKAEYVSDKDNYSILSTHLYAGKIQLTIFSETDPCNGFAHKNVNLEDVYFSAIKGAGRMEAAHV